MVRSQHRTTYRLIACLFVAWIVARAGVARPGVARPGAARPEADQPGAVQPDVRSSAMELPPTSAGPLVIRVGLASDLRSLRLPCCDRRLSLRAGDEVLPLSQAYKVSPVGTLADQAVYRLQVAALKDERQARGLAAQLAETMGQAADAVFDAGTDLYRVRVGRYADRQQAEVARRRLEGLGLRDNWVASEGGALEDPAFEIVDGDGGLRTVPGRWLEISAPPELGVPHAGVRYRGRLLIFLKRPWQPQHRQRAASRGLSARCGAEGDGAGAV